MTDLEAVQRNLGLVFKDPALLYQALTHRSYLNEYPEQNLISNERLEFLGDALIGLVVAHKLYTRFPHLPEGDLTRLRVALVRKDYLARMAQSLHLGDYLLMGRGEESSGGRERPRNLAGALEALVGAILLDRGFRASQAFVLRHLGRNFEEALEEWIATDHKSRLQEVAQARGKKAPFYRLVEATGPEHDRKFVVEAVIDGEAMGRGEGRSKI